MYDLNSPSQWYHLGEFWLVYHGLITIFFKDALQRDLYAILHTVFLSCKVKQANATM